MSLIEQAAKRLEELRRSGAMQGDDVAAPADAPGVADYPTPEAIVRALEARRETQPDASTGEPRTVTAAIPSATPTRRVASLQGDLAAARHRTTARPPAT